MRILTPAEQREVERIKRRVTEMYSNEPFGESVVVNIVCDNRELWLNILDLALQANEAMKTEWQGSLNLVLGDVSSEVLDKLRPNG